MSDISAKIRNYPNAFAKPSEVCKLLASYSILQERNPEGIYPPKKNFPFQFGGISGVPIYYNTEEKRVYVDHTDKHTAVIGPTASKKSRLVAMPTVRLLGAAGESMIISDPKAEIYNRTAAYLKEIGYEIRVLNLRQPQYGVAWNPLSIPYQFFKAGDIDRAYEFANDIAVNLTNVDKSQKEAFWDNSAGSFLFGLILLLFLYCDTYNKPAEAVNIGNILNLRNAICAVNGIRPQNNPLWKFAKKDPFISSALIGTIETANDTRAGILSTFDQKMRAFSIQPSLLNMLAFNNIDYTLLTDKPTAVYLLLPDEKTGYHGLVSLFVKQSYEFLIHQVQNKLNEKQDLGIRINYILDEFSSLPTISDFSAMITAARSRNIRFNLFLQSKQQLRLRYGEDCDTILSNCENWIFLTSRELEFLKEVSELCGVYGGSPPKPLLSISDLQRFDKSVGEALLLSGRNKPMITRLVDIDSFDGGRPSPATYDTAVAREAYMIDFQKAIQELAAMERKSVLDTTSASKIEVLPENDFLPIVPSTIEKQVEIHPPTYPTPVQQQKENKEEDTPNDK